MVIEQPLRETPTTREPAAGEKPPSSTAPRPAAAPLWLAAGVMAAAALALFPRRTWRTRRPTRKVRDVMIQDVVTIDVSATLKEAAERMRETNVGVLPVIEFGQVRGMITDRDLAVRAVARGLDPAATRIWQCMSDSPVCAHPDWDVDEAMDVMADCQIGRLPVVDARDNLVGIVTLGSLALRSREEAETLRAAREVSRRSARA